jgi:hypothetical protein
MAAAPKEVVITGIDIPFFAAVWLIVKWSLASIPAMLILWVGGLVFTSVAGALAAAILAALGMASNSAP